MPRTVKRLVEEVGVGVFDAVVVGDWEAVGVRVVDGGSAGKHGFGRVRGLAPTVIGCWGDDRDEQAEEVTLGAQVGGPLGGTAWSIINGEL